MNKVIKVSSIIVLAVIFGFFFVVANLLFGNIFIDQSAGYITDGVSAFMGAFFAFLFLRLGDFFSRIAIREKIAYNELVYLQLFFADSLSFLQETRIKLEDFIDSLNSGNFWPGFFSEFPTRDKGDLLNLDNIDLLNKALKLMIDIRRVNDGLRTANQWNIKLEHSVVSGFMSIDNYKTQHAPPLVEQLNQLVNQLTPLEDELLDLLAESRLLLEEGKPIVQSFIELTKIRRRMSVKKIKDKRGEIIAEAQKVKEKSKIS